MGNWFTRGAYCALLIATLLACGCGGRSAQAPVSAELPAAATPTPDFRLDAPAPGGVDGVLWGKLQAALREALARQAKAGCALALPLSEGSRVDDFAIAPDTAGQAVASWLYRNPGDYSQNGVVDAGDLVPLAMYYGALADGENWARASVADGDGDGQVGLSDAVAIAANYGHAIGGYAVQGGWSAEEDGVWSEVGQALFSDSTLRPYDGRREFRLPVAAELEHFYRCVPELPGAAQPGLPSNARQYFGGVAGPGQWPMAGGDPQRSSFSATPGPTQRRVRPLFDAETGENIRGRLGPVLTHDNGVVMIGYDSVSAYGLNGIKHWTWSDSSLYHSERSIALGPDGAIYGTGRLHEAANPDTVFCLGNEGRLRWLASIALFDAEIVPTAEQVYVCSPVEIACFSSEGVRLGSYPLSGEYTPSLAVDLQGGAYCTDGMELCKFTAGGAPAWRISLPAQSVAGLAIRQDGVVLVPTVSGLYAFDASGARLWRGGSLPWLVRALAVAPTDLTVLVADPDASNPGRMMLLTLAPNGAVLNQAELSYRGTDVTLLLDSAYNLYLHTGATGLHCLNTSGVERFSFFAYNDAEDSPGAKSCALGTDGALYLVQGTRLYCLADDGQNPAPAPQLNASNGQYADHIRLTWTAVAGVANYHIYRDGNPAPLAALTGLKYDDYGVWDAQPHSYTVHAISALGKGGPSNTAQGRLQPLGAGPGGAGDWAMYGRDAQRTFSAGVIGTDQGQLRWSRTLDEGLYENAPVFASDGTLYVTSGSRIEALAPQGEEVWRLDAPGRIGRVSVGQDGTLFFRTAASESEGSAPPPPTGELHPPFWEAPYAVDAAAVHALAPDRTQRWQYILPPTASDIKLVVTLGSTGRLYTGVDKAGLMALSTTGKLLSKVQLADCNDLVHLLTADTTGNLYALARTYALGSALLQLDAELHEIWRYDFGDYGNDAGYPTDIPAVGADGTLYLPGTHTFIGVAGGGFTSHTPGSGQPLALANNGRLYVAGDPEFDSDQRKGLGYFEAGVFVRVLDPPLLVRSNIALDAEGKVYLLAQIDAGTLSALCYGADNNLVWSLALPEWQYTGEISLGNDGTLYAVVGHTLCAIGAP